MSKIRIFLREETKANERRTPITPETAKDLIQSGNFEIFVQKWGKRIFADDEYAAAGCTLVDDTKEITADTFVFGLKHLPEDGSPVTNKHVYFAHCFKSQNGWKELLLRFAEGKGIIFDIEFLVDENNRRVAAFGAPAGFAGCALGLLNWAQQQLEPTVAMPGVASYESEVELIAVVSKRVQEAVKVAKRTPKVIVLGALGRVGSGCQDLLAKVEKQSGLTFEKLLWDMAETKRGGPFEEIVDCDVFVNCIYLMGKTPPFVTNELLDRSGRKLSVLVDVSCDYDNPNNPVPVYNQDTKWAKPALRIRDNPPLDVISIDNLPSLIPRESSLAFAKDLLPTIKTLPDGPVWLRAKAVFDKKLAEAQT